MADSEITQEQFTERFIAYCLGQQHRIISSPAEIEAYARASAPIYWAEARAREEGPEACVESDLDCWEG